MYIYFFVSLFIVGVVSLILSIWSSGKFYKPWRILFFLLVVSCLAFQTYFGYSEKKAADLSERRNGLFQDQSLYRQSEISQDIKELKEKDKKGLLTDVDYDRYIALYLENISLTLKQLDRNNLREWTGIYFDNVDKIPKYYTYEEWKESEKFIYSSILNEIIGSFASRNIQGGGRDKVIQDFKDARNRLLTAKDREFKK